MIIDDSKEIKDKVFDRIVEFIRRRNCTSSEVLNQDDTSLIDAPDVLGELIDMIVLESEHDDLPKYVKMVKENNSICLRLWDDEYYRDAGCWSVGWEFVDGKLMSTYCDDNMPWLHGVSLIEVSKEEWMDDNKGYV